jgi:hypothetical protein
LIPVSKTTSEPEDTMSTKLTHRKAAQLPTAVVVRVDLRTSGAAGIHQDQNRKRGPKHARGGRQGARNALRKEWA